MTKTLARDPFSKIYDAYICHLQNYMDEDLFILCEKVIKHQIMKT